MQSPALNNSYKSPSRRWDLPSSGLHEGKRKKDVRPRKVKQICRTKGLTSADRSNKATLLLTVPRPDSSRLQRIHPRPYFFSIQDKHAAPFRTTHPAQVWFTAEAYSNTTNMCGTNIIVSSTDSDLEAFSHNLADDSFAPLPDRTGANTNYLNEQFLSYYPQLLLR